MGKQVCICKQCEKFYYFENGIPDICECGAQLVDSDTGEIFGTIDQEDDTEYEPLTEADKYPRLHVMYNNL